MLKKMSIRLRLTVLCMLLLTICCIGLTIVLIVSANKMADVIEAIPVAPDVQATPDIKPIEQFKTVSMASLTPSNDSQAARVRFLHQSIGYMILIVVVGGGLIYYISGKALNPLQELSGQMKNRTVHNLSEDLPVPESHDEIADLTLSFNEMSGKLDAAFAMQKRFSQCAAHELRTPLAVLKTNIDVFKKKKEPSAEEYNHLFSVITTHTSRLFDLVKDLLTLTNMDALECDENIELKTMLTDVTKELSCLMKEKNITTRIYGEKQTILGNRSLLHRAFYNLVENAVKYNIENGQVEILISFVSEQSMVTIIDTGIGIPAEMREIIFEPFFRVDKSRSRQMGGAGLGLSTVKSIVDKHQGQILISENPVGGTIFEIIL